MSKEFLSLTQGPATSADEHDLDADAAGITHPNLHRRIVSDAETSPEEVASPRYSLSVYGVNSYRATETFLHAETSVTTEVP